MSLDRYLTHLPDTDGCCGDVDVCACPACAAWREAHPGEAWRGEPESLPETLQIDPKVA